MGTVTVLAGLGYVLGISALLAVVASIEARLFAPPGTAPNDGRI